jgi:uncharacterized protein (TIGR02145 family)
MKKNVFILGLLIFCLVFTSEFKVWGQENMSSQTEAIQLLSGCNLISLDVMPTDNTPASIFATLIAESKLVYVSGYQNQEGVFFDPYGPDFLNTLINMNPGEGYWVKVNAACSLVVSGDPIPETLSIDLASGWNLIGYWLTEPMAPTDAFAEIIPPGYVVYVSGFVNQEGVFFDPNGPDFLNTLDTLRNGYGYWLKLNTAKPDFTYPATATTWQCGNLITDARDGQTYETVQIGDQCWIAQNLNTGTMIYGVNSQTDNGIIEKYCYDNNPANCDVYGGLYQWDEMMEYSTLEGVQGICPTGWHLPTDAEWTALSDYLGGEGVAGIKMKETGTIHWFPPNTGATNSSGFTGIPGGFCSTVGSFFNLGDDGNFWSSTELSANTTWERGLSYDYSYLYHGNEPKGYGFSVRCLRDLENTPPASPSNPSPEDGATNKPVNLSLSWLCSDPDNDPLTYDVFLGTVPNPQIVVTGLTENSYTPGVFENFTTYYWKIVAHDNHDHTTEGTVWSFTTGDQILQCGNPFTDTRDGQSYETVQIGTQCWMKENLNVGTMINGGNNQTDNGIIEKYCYNNDPANCDVYGGLYQWHEMMDYSTISGVQGICPPNGGWHLPTDTEWTTFTTYLGGESVAGGKMKETGTTHWTSPNTGATNSSGFTGLPGGFWDTYGSFYYLSLGGSWWSSTQADLSHSWFRDLFCDDAGVYTNNYGKEYGFSVRCLKDLENTPPTSPSNPSPQDGSVNEPINLSISWSCSDPDNDPLTYDICLGTVPNPQIVVTGLTENSYTPGVLENFTTYYWKIVAHDNHDHTTEGIVWSFTTSDQIWQCGNPLTDTRDGKSYETVQIGTHCWMKENLNIGTRIDGMNDQTNNGVIEKYCYNSDPTNCDVYGGLYNWNEIMEYATTEGVQGICLTGWHLPSDAEWTALSDYLGGESVAGGKMKETGIGLWYSPNTGATNSSGFSGLPGGYRDASRTYDGVGIYGSWWSSTEYAPTYAWSRYLAYFSAAVYRDGDDKNYGFSVRCLKDETYTSQLTVTPANQNVTAAAGTTTFNVTSNTSWSVEENLEWLSVSPVSGNNNETITVNYDENPSGEPREGQITVTADGGNPVVNLTVNQAGSSQFVCGQSFTDTRDEQSYETVQIGTQCWMKENLNVGTRIDSIIDQSNNATIEKYCYHNLESNCDVYGGLYQWNEMMQYSISPGVQGICPNSWHLPSDDEWEVLSTYLGDEGGALKESGTTHWIPPNGGATNSSGFTALPAGVRFFTDFSFYDLGTNAYFWSSSQGDVTGAWTWHLFYGNAGIGHNNWIKSYGFSVRCIKDETSSSLIKVAPSNQNLQGFSNPKND